MGVGEKVDLADQVPELAAFKLKWERTEGGKEIVSYDPNRPSLVTAKGIGNAVFTAVDAATGEMLAKISITVANFNLQPGQEAGIDE